MAQQNHHDTSVPSRVVGLVELIDGRLVLTDKAKKSRNKQYPLSPGSARAGDVVVAEPDPRTQVLKITRVLGQADSPGIQSAITICEKGLSESFSQAAMNEAQGMTVPGLEGREDLRNIPLVTVDGADARDFDDAIFSEKTPDGGHHLIVAIADVSWYVRPGSPLDKEALQRGNSTYLPDRVLPMLPEELSNGLCSLKPNEDRACMAFHLWIDKEGNLTQQKVVRGLMKSKARLTYQQMQAAKDGAPDTLTAPLMDKVINPLYDAFAVLRKARDDRGALDIDKPEYQFSMNANGSVNSVSEYKRYDSCKVIEEFMILANVAAGRALKEKGVPCVYRAHETPPYLNNERKESELTEYFRRMGVKLPKGDVKAADFNEILKQAATLPDRDAIISAVQMVQAKARYTTEYNGHFGLALDDYAHYTSPIRRYSDLLVHRLLAYAYNLGPGGMKNSDDLEEMAKMISGTEITSSEAERDTKGRLTAKFMEAAVGKVFTGSVMSVKNFGVFVRLNNANGASGLLHISKLQPRDFYEFDSTRNALVGKNTGHTISNGTPVTVRLISSDGLSGEISLAGVNDNNQNANPKPDFKRTQQKPRRG